VSGNFMLNGGKTTFGEWHLTDAGERRFKAYDYKKDDPALKCIGTSWTRVWLNPNVLVKITQGCSDYGTEQVGGMGETGRKGGTGGLARTASSRWLPRFS